MQIMFIKSFLIFKHDFMHYKVYMRDYKKNHLKL